MTHNLRLLYIVKLDRWDFTYLTGALTGLLG